MQGYVKPTQKILIDNYAAKNEISESEAVSIAVKHFFDIMPKEVKLQYLNFNKPVKE